MTTQVNNRGQQGNRDADGNFVTYAGPAFPELIEEANGMEMEELMALRDALSAKNEEEPTWKLAEQLRIVNGVISKREQGDEEELPEVNLDVNF